MRRIVGSVSNRMVQCQSYCYVSLALRRFLLRGTADKDMVQVHQHRSHTTHGGQVTTHGWRQSRNFFFINTDPDARSCLVRAFTHTYRTVNGAMCSQLEANEPAGLGQRKDLGSTSASALLSF